MMEAVAAIPPFERFYDERKDEIFGYLARLLAIGYAQADSDQRRRINLTHPPDELRSGR